MATRSIVPRSDNEGGIGTSLKKWATGFIKLLTVDTINKVTVTSPASGSTLTIADGKTINVTADTTLDAEAAQVLDVVGGGVQGDTLFRGTSGWERLAKGSAHQQLQMNSAGNSPEFVTDPMSAWMIDIDVFMSPGSSTNWDTPFSVDTTYASAYAGNRTSTGAQNAEITWPVVLSAGTWKFCLMHVAWNQCGIYSVQIDGVEKGTIDGYSSTATYNVISTISDIAISAPGKYTLKLKMATKNPSSPSYKGSLQKIRLIRTA